MRKKEFFRLTPFKMQVLQSFPFIDADFDALTNYELLCKVVEYLNITVDNVNLLNDDFKTLYNYVHDYFDNLDVQEEINNKLDEMAESGQLADIIAQYLGLAGVLSFNTVSDMKLATNLVDGSTAHTLGYYNVNDKGTAFYKIRTITNDDVVDEKTIISLYDNTLIAELIINNEMNIEVFGAKGDGTTDDSNALNVALNKCSKINFSNKTYYFNTEMYFTENKEITLQGYNTTIKGLSMHLNTSNDTSWVNAYMGNDFIIKNITFLNNSNTRAFISFQPMKIIDCTATDYDNFIKLGYNSSQYIDKFYINKLDIKNHTGSDYLINLPSLGDQHYIEGVHFTSGSNRKVLTCYGKRAINFVNCLNGSYYVDNSNADFNGCHFENGEIDYNTEFARISNIKLNNCFFFKQVKLPAGKTIEYNNCVFLINPEYNKIAYDNNIVNDYMSLNTKNSIIKAHENVNLFNDGLVELDMNNNTTSLTYSSNKPCQNVQLSNNNGYWTGTKNITYRYDVYTSKMKNAINGMNYQYSHVQGDAIITDTTNCVRINGVYQEFRNTFFHIFRTNLSTNEIEYAVIPTSGSKIFDYGDNINGVIWQTIASIPTLTASNITVINDIVKVNSGTLNGSNYMYIDNTDNTVKYKAS